jgi:hypothetical protein
MGKERRGGKRREAFQKEERENEREFLKETRERGRLVDKGKSTGLTSLTQAGTAGPEAQEGNSDRGCAKTRQAAK